MGIYSIVSLTQSGRSGNSLLEGDIGLLGLPLCYEVPPATGYDYGYGGGSAFGPGGSAFHSSGPAIPYAGIPQELISTVRDFNIDCKKDHMVINFKYVSSFILNACSLRTWKQGTWSPYFLLVGRMSQPFFGFIYPVGLFETCILFVGTGETEISLTMSHDRCGAPAPPKKPGYSRAFIEPVMQVIKSSSSSLTSPETLQASALL